MWSSRAIIGWILAAGLCGAGDAVAGTVYRCDGPQGRSYVTHRIRGATCVVASAYTPQTYRPATAVAPPGNVAAFNAPAASAPAASSPAALSAPAAATPSRPRFRRMVTTTTYAYTVNGARMYSNTRPRGVANVQVMRIETPVFEMDTCYACGVQPGVNFGSTRLNLQAYRQEIAAAARDFGVDEAIVRAIIHAESAFRPTAISRVGAQGLMQLMPATARRFGVSNAFDAGQNIRGGVQYLAWLLRRFNGNLRLAAAGYNAGEGAVDRHGGIPPYSETRRYVERVTMLAGRYRSEAATGQARAD